MRHTSSESPLKVIKDDTRPIFKVRFDIEEKENGFEYSEIEIKMGAFEHETLVAEIVRTKFSVEEIERVALNGEDDSAINSWRKHAVDIADDIFGVERDSLEIAKEKKIAEITKYDKSSAVNEFSIMDMVTWLPLNKRIDMRQSLVSLKAKGFEEFTYWLGTIPITLPISEFESILDTVEVYAIQCFNVTASHKAAILALESVEDVESYDITSGYPEKISLG